jgi:hypothetical protein
MPEPQSQGRGDGGAIGARATKDYDAAYREHARTTGVAQQRPWPPSAARWLTE